MKNIKPFLVPKDPNNDKPNDYEDYNGLSNELANSFLTTPTVSHRDVMLSDEELADLREYSKSDAQRLIEHFGPKMQERQSTLERQVKAIEQIAINAENNARNSNQIAGSADKLSYLASKKANQADTKGWIAVIISALALTLEIVLNRSELFFFFQSLIP